MKILLITDRLDNGGAETHLLTLATALSSEGHSVTVASSGGAVSDRLVTLGIPHLTLPLDKKGPISLVICFICLLLQLKKDSVDVIHSHARVPSLISHYLARLLNIPLVVTAHARFSTTPLRRFFSRWGNSTVAVSEDLKQYLIDSYSLPPENITVIPNGIDLKKFPLSPRESKRVKRIAFMSRLDRDCSLGARLLCSIAPELCRNFGELEIAIGGGGECFEEIASLAKVANGKIGFECVRAVGRISDVWEFLASADLFVGVSRAAAEAALVGLPVILCGDEGFFGPLSAESFELALSSNLCSRGCPPPTEPALLSALSSILVQNPSSLRSSSLALRSMLARVMDSRATALATIAVYESTIRPSRRSTDVILCGYYGFGNMGDDAMLRAAVRRVQGELPDASVAALTRYPIKNSREFSIRCIDRTFIPSVIWAIARCRYFILGGGTLLQSQTSRRSLLYYSLLTRLAHLLGARCLIWGNGLGELGRAWERSLVGSVLSRCEYIGIRDRRSYSLAQALSPCKPRLEGDLTEGIAPCSESRALIILNEIDISSANGFIIVAPKDEPGSEELESAIFEKTLGGTLPIFVAMHSARDSAICSDMSKKLGGTVLSKISYSDLLGIIRDRRCRGVYSMRFHALLAARRMGKPYLAFGSDPKLCEFTDLSEQET